MRTFSSLLTFILVGVCFGAEQKPTVQGKEPSYEGKTVSEWITQSKDKDADIRRAAIKALGEIRSEAKETMPVLMRSLKDKDAGVRRAATASLGRIGPEAKVAVPMLTELLKDRDIDVRWMAAEALGHIGPEAKTSIAAIIELLKDQDEIVRSNAVEALGDIGPEAKIAIPAITELLKEKDAFIRRKRQRRPWEISAPKLGQLSPHSANYSRTRMKKFGMSLPMHSGRSVPTRRPPFRPYGIAQGRGCRRSQSRSRSVEEDREGEKVVTDRLDERSWLAKGRQTPRKPATKLAHLRKKMEKNRIVAKIGKKNK